MAGRSLSAELGFPASWRHASLGPCLPLHTAPGQARKSSQPPARRTLGLVGRVAEPEATLTTETY